MLSGPRDAGPASTKESLPVAQSAAEGAVKSYTIDLQSPKPVGTELQAPVKSAHAANLDAGAETTRGIYFMYDVEQFDPAEWSSPPLEGKLDEAVCSLSTICTRWSRWRGLCRSNA